MKAEELRIGNLVRYAHDSTEFKVIGINGNGIDVQNETETTWIEIEEFEPIPITEKWLEKFGFEKYNECFYKIEVKHGYSDGWYLSHDNELTKSMSEFFVRLKYVHELQNFCFAVTGWELILK